MAQNQDRKFINGLFAKRVWSSGDSQLLSVGIKKDEFIRNLQALSADANGFVNLTLGSQKADPEKMSLWLSEQKNSGSKQQSYSKPSSYSQQSKPQQNTPPPDDTDDLPF